MRLTRAQRRRESAYWQSARRAEHGYALSLRRIARHIGDLIRGFPAGEEAHLPELQHVLESYSNILNPWARSVSARMLADVARRDELAWKRHSEMIGRNLRREIQDAPIGALMRQLQHEQVDLITSIPIEAGERVQALTRELVAGGRRYSEIVPEIMRSGEVTATRATLIARTETAKAQTSLLEARALHVGSEGYIWVTAGDADVRRMHRRLSGTFHRWDDPPVAEENGARHHPGCFPSCRCYATPVLPDTIE